jgi:tetratricopeptide (TPR) repeat protein
MKTIIFLLFGVAVFAQPAPCDAKIAEINALVRDSKLDEAYDVWSVAGKCATATEAVIADAEKILTNKLERASGDAKKEFVAKLAKLYDDYDKAFPGNANANLVKKAMLLKTYKAATDDEIFASLDRAFSKDLEHFNDPNALYIYFDLFFNRFKTSETAMDDALLFTKEDAVSVKLKQLADANPGNERPYVTAIDGIRALTEPVSTCDKLEPYYTAALEANKTNVAWLETVTVRLLYKNCPDGALLLKAAEAWHQTAKSPRSAYNLGLAYMRNRQKDKALEMFNWSANQQPDPDEKAKTFYLVASTFTTAEKSQSIAYLKKAIGARPQFGKAYIMLAQHYANSADCTDNAFEKKALYFLAANTVAKGGKVDPSIAMMAERQAQSYLRKAPTKDEIKDAKMGGKTIAYKCYINESVTVPRS